MGGSPGTRAGVYDVAARVGERGMEQAFPRPDPHGGYDVVLTDGRTLRMSRTRTGSSGADGIIDLPNFLLGRVLVRTDSLTPQ
jgi:hypothetical protein